jgi:hypothetical protein
MSKTSFTVAPSNASDASFRVWGKALSDALTAVGCAKTADTGQIDWATVTRAALSTYAGYEIRTLPASALQTACPVYIKIEYGAGATQTYCALRMTIGRATDGAGNLTGITSSAIALVNGATSTTATDCYVSCGDDYVSWAMWTGSTNTILQAFYVTRPKNSTGTALGTGVQIVGQCTNLANQQFLPLTGSALPFAPMTSLCCAAPKVGTGTYGANLGVFPIFTYMGYAAYPDAIGIGYFSADIATGGTPVTVEIFGANHDFVTVGVTNNGALAGNTAVSSLMIRWE